MKERVFLLLFISGFVILGIGLALYLKGPQKDLQHESATLYSGRIYVPGNDSNYLGTPTDSISLFVNNTIMLADSSSNDGKITVCLMNESQFSDWKTTQNRSDNIIARTIDASYNFSIEPEIGEVYYYVFQNPYTQQNSLEFTVRVEGDFLRFDYGPCFFYLGAAIVGGCLCLASGWKLRKVFAQWNDRWEEPIIRTPEMEKNKIEIGEISSHSASLKRKFLRYAVLALVVVTIITYMPLLQLVSPIMSYQFLRPEYRVVFLDYMVRTFLVRFFEYLPSVLILASLVLFLIPRLSDVSRFSAIKLHLEGPKQYLIGKELANNLFRAIRSKRLVVFLVVIMLPFFLARFVFSILDNGFSIAYMVAAMSTFGVYLGFLTGLLVDRAYKSQQIRKYAQRHFFWGSLLSVTIMGSPLVFITYVAVLFNASDFYFRLLDDAFFLPVKLNRPFSLLAANASLPELPMVAVGSLVVTFATLVFLMFLVPFLYSKTTREILSAVVVFMVVEATQGIFTWIIGGTMGEFFQPLSLLAPIAASAVAGGLHKHYKKRIERIVRVQKKKSLN